MQAQLQNPAGSSLVQRHLTLVCGIMYALWWFAVHWLLPRSFNPIASRASVVAFFLSVWILSYLRAEVRRQLHILLPLTMAVATAHYFYLFYLNRDDVYWVVGSYITVVAAAACLVSRRALFAYSLWVVALSAALVASEPALLKSIFMPGMCTILLLANLSLHIRCRLLDQLRASTQEIEQLYQATLASEETRIQYESTRRSLRMREEYIGIIAHELNTPLTVIKLRTQGMLRNLRQGVEFDSQRVQRFAEDTHHQTERLARLVEEMLDVSRIIAGKLPMASEPVDMSASVRDTVVSFCEATGTAAQFSWDVEPNLWINGDRLRIEQVVLNMLTNVLKYGRGKAALVGLRAAATWIELSVRDGGLGIDPTNQERIFERFERAVAARDTSGLGLGLFICREIVTAHGGTMTVKSQLGEGATFTVRLPRLLTT